MSIGDNKFKEASLPRSFCRPAVRQIKGLVDLSTTFSVVGMPGMGISNFLYFLSMQEFACFIHVDINELPRFAPEEFFTLLAKKLGAGKKEGEVLQRCREQLETLAAQHRKVVIVFNRFDTMKRSFSREFFANLKYLRDADKGKIVMVFAANRPLFIQAPNAVRGGNINMFSHSLFLPPYSPSDLRELLKLYTPVLLSHSKLDLALRLCGGHYQLLRLLLRSDHLSDDPLKDPAVKIQLRELFEYLTYSERRVLKQLALGKKINLTDDYLVDCGWISKDRGRYRFFSPLFEEFVKSVLKINLPPQETKLFRLLRSRLEKTVSKEEIFKTVWADNPEQATDWALDALIYRLRKNPVFAKKYILESRKKVGYVLFPV